MGVFQVFKKCTNSAKLLKASQFYFLLQLQLTKLTKWPNTCPESTRERLNNIHRYGHLIPLTSTSKWFMSTKKVLVRHFAQYFTQRL